MIRLMYLARLANLIVGDKSQKFLSDQTTYQTLLNIVPTMGGHIISNISIPLKSNERINVNFVYLTRYGIFVIETKNITGKILGNDNDDYWALYYDKVDPYKVNNAVLVNNLAVQAVERLLGLEDELINMVCFIKADIRNLNSKHSYYPYYLAKEILSYKVDPIYSDEEIEEFYNTLTKIKNNPIMSYDEYIDIVGNIKIKDNHIIKRN